MGCSQSSDTNLLAEEADQSATNAKNLKSNNVGDVHTVKPLEVNEMTLTDFLQIERDIAEAEARNPLKPLDIKTDQLTQLSAKIEHLEEKLANLEKEASSSPYRDDVETHKFFILNGVQDELSPEQQTYLDLLNQKEITTKELEATKLQYKQVSREVENLQQKAEELQQLYKRQDELLDQIFGGSYGSLRENQLENELDHLEAQRGRILEANFKWRQGQMMLEYACKQLAVAVQKWKELPHLPTLDLEIRYSVAADTRNNVVAAGQNINGAQRFLEKVDFPYCNPKEVNTLNKAAQYVFTDMQSEDRQRHASDCYEVTHRRANALLQWFDTVINSTIMNDLQEVNERVKSKTLELRRERVRLIKLKVKEMTGKDLQLDQTLRGRDISANELAKALLSDNQVVKVDETVEAQGVIAPPPLGENELAPVPSNTVIFGNMYNNYKNQIEALTKQHQDELQAFMKEQELNQQKIQGTLEEKLMARRQRRARQKMEETQRMTLQS